MKIYKNTNTIDDYLNLDRYIFTQNKSEADLMIVGGKAIELDEFPNLKGIFKTGVGIDNLPFKEAENRGIAIQLPSQETRDIIYHETASFTLYLILKFVYRDTGIFSTWQKNNRKSLQDYKVLVMGTGKIGSKLVDRISPLCKVLTYDPLNNTEEDLAYLLGQADIISLHMPFLEKTKNFFDHEKLSLLKDGALLINTARGSIIDEDALFNVLKDGRINAAIDVFWQEPYDGKLTQINSQNIFLSPHVASTCKGFLEGLANDFLNFYNKHNQ
jgi:phosphoglycerate dehydrogenase-like enzyme